MAEKVKKLYKSRKDRIVFGVCGGLAEYFDADPVLVRLIAIILILAPGPGIAVYILLAIIIPSKSGIDSAEVDDKVVDVNMNHIKQNVKEMADDVSKNGRSPLAWFLIVLGTLLLFQQLFPWSWLNWQVFWPLIIIGVGLLFLFRR
ncbi:MAG: PspC domain-containing protein [Patescibacteria group bacterium]